MAVSLSGVSGHALKHFQIINCGKGFEATSLDYSVRNALLYNITNIFSLSHTARLENVTLDTATYLNVGNGATLWFTNCLITSVTNGPGSYNGASNTVLSSSSGVYQTNGAGEHYLAAAYRSSGTTNINASLLSDLRQRTTYPPRVLTNTISTNLTLGIQALRETNSAPDIGYAYAPLDFAVHALVVTNAALTLAEGTAIAVYGTNGLWLQDNSTLLAQGSPTRRVHFVRYNSVQERPVLWGTTTPLGSWGGILIDPYNYSNAPPTGRLRFTDVDLLPGNDYYSIYSDHAHWTFAALEIKDCQFSGGWLAIAAGGGAVLGITNSLLERLTFTSAILTNFNSWNALYRGVGGTLQDASAGLFKDNLLDGFSGFGWNLTNVPTSATNVIAVAAGGYHTLALRADGPIR